MVLLSALISTLYQRVHNVSTCTFTWSEKKWSRCIPTSKDSIVKLSVTCDLSCETHCCRRCPSNLPHSVWAFCVLHQWLLFIGTKQKPSLRIGFLSEDYPRRFSTHQHAFEQNKIDCRLRGTFQPLLCAVKSVKLSSKIWRPDGVLG